MARRRLALLLTLFFLSGACGLTYQVLWLRLLALVFGVTVYAASTVLAAFMGGLAIGSMLAGPLLRRVRRPLVIFGVAEVLIGLSALATPLGLDAAETLYRALFRVFPDSFAFLTVARLVCALVVLLVPTALMGLTLPVLSAAAAVQRSPVSSRVGALYAANTAGAVIGALVTGFILIGTIGIHQSFLLAAATNVSLGAIAATWGLRSPALDPTSTDTAPEPAVGRAYGIPLVIALSGLAALALEIVWFRMLVLYLDATTYAFTTMLATVLTGIAVGGAIGSRVLRRARDWIAWLTMLQLATGIAVLASSALLAWIYGGRWHLTSDAEASVAAMLPATLLMGISLPIALGLGLGLDPREPAAAGHQLGRLYALNVAGAIVGALVGGFVAIPLLGTRRALMAGAVVYILSACILGLRDRRRPRLMVATLLGIAVFAVTVRHVPDPFTAAFEHRYGRDMREFWRYDGVQTAVSVHASQFRRSLYLDGLHQANDTPDMVRLHRVIGHLPMVLHPNPIDALVVGLGGGATAGAVSQYPARVQVVELSEGVRQAAQFFTHISYDVLQQPRVRLRVDDGRNFLLVSGERFDVVTADIIQPSHAGAGNLYSREYFTLVRRALKDKGLAMQWIGHRSTTQYKLIMRTFLSVFPDTTLWFDGELMVGSLSPLTITREIFDRKRADPLTATALNDVGLTDFETLTRWYTAGPEELRRFVGEGPVLTDDQPLLEFHRSLQDNEPPVDLSGLRGRVADILKP